MQYVDSALDRNADDRLAAWLSHELRTASALTLRTGFYSTAAVEVVRAGVVALLERGGEFLAVLGGDLLQVDAPALQTLLEVCQRYPDRARAFVITESAFQNAKTYHVTHADGQSSAWVGSANLTMGGLSTNLEAAVTLNSGDDDPLLLERVHAATVAAAEEPSALPLDNSLIEQLQLRMRESRFRFGRAALGSTSQLVSGHGQQLLEDLDQIASGDHGLLLLPTGFPDLDDLLDGGLRPGTLTVVASRPGAGRSTLVLNVLSHAALTKHIPSCLFTFDTSAQDVLLRVLSADTAIDYGYLRRARMTDTDWSYTVDRMAKLSEEPLHVNAGTAPHLEGLCAAIAAATARERLAVVAVDPLSAVLARTFADNREREVAEVVRRLKALAMQLQLRLVVTAELGRQATHPGWRPELTDLRDSDVIAQVADHVILIHQPERSAPDRTHLIVAKNRHGRRGVVPVLQRLSVSRFEPLTRPSPPPAPRRPDGRTSTPAAPSRPTRGAPGQEDQEVTVDGHVKWRVRRTGAGSPTLIYLGRADPADDEWAKLTAGLQALTRIVTYDRPGLAGGDPLTAQVAKGLHSISSATRDLETLLLESAKVPPPYLLVASSIGCWIADQFAVQWPRWVTGMVLIDPINLTPWPTGEHERLITDGNDGETGYLQRLSADSFAELADRVPTEPRRNVVISSSDGRWQRHPPAAVTEWKPDSLAELDALWQGYQRAWVRRTNARHVIAGTAGHLVHRDQPDLVAGVVTAVVEAARARKAVRLDPDAIATSGGRLASAKRT